MRKFKALETIEGLITKGNIYQESRKYTGVQDCYRIIGDDGFEHTLFKERFEVVEKLSDTITFASQEEFENAVMEAVLKRLGVCIDMKATPYGNSKAYLPLEDLV